MKEELLRMKGQSVVLAEHQTFELLSGCADMRFLSALLIGEISKRSHVNFLNGVYGMEVNCHAQLCNVWIPFTAENIPAACYIVKKMAEYLRVDYECDVEDIIDVQLATDFNTTAAGDASRPWHTRDMIHRLKVPREEMPRTIRKHRIK